MAKRSNVDARPLEADWVRQVRDRCQAEAVPLYFKQWGVAGDARDHAAHHGGKTLDGVDWLQFPDYEHPAVPISIPLLEEAAMVILTPTPENRFWSDIRDAVDSYLRRRLDDIPLEVLAMLPGDPVSCRFVLAVYEDIRKRMAVTAGNGRPFRPITWEVGTYGTKRVGKGGQARGLQEIGEKVGEVTLSPADIVIAAAGHPMFWILMLPKQAGVLLLSNADGLSDTTRQKVLAVVDQTAWGVVANDVIRHRAAEIARFGDPGEIDEIARSVAAERWRKQEEADRRIEQEAKRARTPTLVSVNTEVPRQSRRVPADPEAAGRYPRQTMDLLDSYTDQEAKMAKTLIDQWVTVGEMYVWAARGSRRRLAGGLCGMPKVLRLLVNYSTSSDEWFTPKPVIQEVLSGLELIPLDLDVAPLVITASPRRGQRAAVISDLQYHMAAELRAMQAAGLPPRKAGGNFGRMKQAVEKFIHVPIDQDAVKALTASPEG